MPCRSKTRWCRPLDDVTTCVQDSAADFLLYDVTPLVQDSAAVCLLSSLVSSLSEATSSPDLWQSLGPCLEHLLGGDQW